MKRMLTLLLLCVLVCMTTAFSLSETKEVHLTREYEWYIDQNNTGEYSNINCGPTSATMVLKYLDETFDKTVEDARKEIKPDGGSWTNVDTVNYINNHGGKVRTLKFNIDTIKGGLQNGSLFILCIDTNAYRSNGNTHAVIVKGYTESCFELYDPDNGKDVLRTYDDIDKAAKMLWYYAIEVYDEKTDDNTDPGTNLRRVIYRAGLCTDIQ
jgi:ABC-type bacteriocin/lantibiotic exporter with double-glycine peptidase domain